MDEGIFETIVRLISQVGFPIVVCGAMFWFINKTMEKIQSAIGAMNNTVLEVKLAINEMRNAIIPNTKVSEEILKKLEQ